MRRWLVWGLASVLLLLLVVPTALYFTARSETGSRTLLRWMVDYAPIELVYQDVQGNLLEGMIFTDFELLVAGSRISADLLDIAWQPQLLLAGTLHVERLHASNLAIRGPIPQAGTESPQSNWPEVALPLRLSFASLQVEGFSYQDERLLERLELAGSLTGSTLRVESLDIQRQESRLQLQGQLGLAGRYPLSLEAQWSYLIDQQTWSGSAEIEGNLTALRLEHILVTPHQIESELQITQSLPAAPAGLSLEDVSIEGAHSAEQLDLRSMLGDWALFNQIELQTQGNIADMQFALGAQGELPWLGASGVEAEGSLNRDRMLLTNVELETPRGPVMAQLEYRFAEQQVNISQLAVSDFQLGGTLEPLQAEVQAQLVLAPELVIDGELISATIEQGPTSINARGPFHFQGGELSSASMELLAGENRFVSSGRLFPEFQLEWLVEAPELGSLLAELTELSNPRLSLQGSGSLQGSIQQPQLTARVEATQVALAGFSADQINLDLTPESAGHRLHLRAPQAMFQQREISELEVTGLLDPDRIELEGRTASDNLALQLGVDAARINDYWQLNLRQLDLQGPPALGNWALDNSWTIEQQSQGWITDRVCWSSRDARLCAQANSSDQQLSADLELDNLPLDFLQYLVNVPLRAEGRLAGALQFQQQGQNRILDLSLESANGSFLVLGQQRVQDPVNYRNLQVSATMRGQLMEAEASVELGDSGRAVAAGNLDFSPQEPQLDADLNLDFDSIQWIEGLVTQVDDVRGNLSLDLQIEGPLGNPAFNVAAELNDGSLMIPQAGIELTELQFSAIPSGANTMDISASARSGEGSVLLEGEVQAPALDAIEARASLQGENFQLLDIATMRLRVNPDLDFAVSPAQTLIEGRLQIPQARAEIRQLPAGGVRPSGDEVIVGDQAASDTGYLNLALDLEIELGSDVEFQGFGLTTGLTGSLEIQQPAGEPMRTFGAIELVGGEYEAYGRTLIVQRGRMTFQGEIDNPGLNVDAEQSYEDYRVGIHLGGTALNPSTTLYSDPAMMQSDILAVLLTGRRLETMSAAEAPTLLSAATQLGIVGGAAIADRIEESFGLSEFGVRDDGQNGQSVVAGAYLLPRLYVEWAQGLFESSSSLELEYRISDQWKLRARSGGSQSMDLIYEIETE